MPAPSSLSFYANDSLKRKPHNVIVVGAGILGASISYHLAKRGARVILLDQNAPGSGTTSASFAWINANNKRPFNYYRLNYEGILGWHRLQQEIGESLVIQWGGSLAWCGSEVDKIKSLKSALEHHPRWGYPIYPIDAATLEQQVAGLAVTEFGAGWHASLEGTLDPVAATRALVSAAQGLGATLVNSPVKHLVMDAERACGVQTCHGVLEADEIVIAAGNATPDLAAQVGIQVPLNLSRGILAHSTPLPSAIHQVLMPPDADIKQNPDGRIVTGANFGDSGDTEPTAELGQTLLDRVSSHFPALAPLDLDYMTHGERVLPIDELPIMGRGSQCHNVRVAAMHSGITAAPIIGQLFSMEILDQMETLLLDDYRPTRFD